MKTKNIPVNLRRLPYNLALTLLTAGASLVLGFLSFSGMYALLPILPLAFLTFVLSVAYEGTIYKKNTDNALNKLLKSNYLKNHLAKEYLSTNFPEHTTEIECPQFFRDYKAQLLLLNQFEHKELSKDNQKRKKQISKTIKDMEHWFAQQLFATPGDANNQSAYSLELQKWLETHNQQEWHKRLSQRNFRFKMVKGFSALTALFMGLGSTYLMVEAFSVIPLFAAIPFVFWPIIIIPLAVIAGTAYGLLTYNAVTDLINNNTVVKWYNKLKADLKQGLTLRNLFMTTTAVFLVTLAVALTVCTAGTWWTIATNARPLFSWMGKMPSFIMGVINPIITGASAIFFNIQNSAESLEMVDEAISNKQNPFKRIYQSIVAGWNHLRNTENGLQMANPFRLLLKLTLTPLRVLLFLGHLISIALTSDRMPGVPQVVAALVAIICEGFEDAGYFFGKGDKKQEPNQKFDSILKEHLDSDSRDSDGVDIPTRLLKALASPIYALAAGWDFLASKLNAGKSTATGQEKRVLSFTKAWEKQRGVAEEEEVILSSKDPRPSTAWQVEHTISLIDKQSKKLAATSVHHELAQQKITELFTLKSKVRTQDPLLLTETLKKEKENPAYNRHRLFAFEQQTATQDFIEELPQRVGLTA